MRQKFLRPSDLSPDQRRRLYRVLARPTLRICLAAGYVWMAFILAVIGFTRVWRPDIDTRGLPFFLAVLPVSFLVLAGAGLVGHVLFFRWLIRYRSRRRGRAVVMRHEKRGRESNRGKKGSGVESGRSSCSPTEGTR